MKKLINVITGVLAGVSPLVIAGILGVFIYNELRNFLGILICIILGLLAVWVGLLIYKGIQKNGIIDFMAVVIASPDLDNLEPTKDSKTKRRTAKELAEFKKNVFKEGTLKIFGDWHGKPYENSLEIIRIDFDEITKQMEIQFSKQTRILIDEPDHILESPTVLKIASAKGVKIEFQHKKNNSTEQGSYFKDYKVVGKKLITETNIDWNTEKVDASIGQDALIIFN